MLWSEVKEHYPANWLLIEAIDATTIDNKRIVEQLSVIDVFNEDSKEALRNYLKLHRTNRARELYVVHTSHEVLDIEEISQLNRIKR